ncbi:MAG: hypothetical protein IH804_03215 [Planctomycetes bacterium]|nr:hypothetical protein [Planctomycetota bacterium]
MGGGGGRQVVRRRCERAAAAGVRSGMSVAHARALLAKGAVRVEPYAPHREAAALCALAGWARRFSPIVATDPPDGLLLDVTGCQRLFGGERRLVDTVAEAVERLGFRTRAALASTFGCARAVARFGRHERSVVPAGAESEVLAGLPVEALRLDEGTAGALFEVGIERIGHVFGLPRAELAERFGADLLRRLDQATGEAAEAIDPLHVVDPPSVARTLAGPTTRLETIMLVVRELVSELAQQLQQRESGARRIDLELGRIDAAPVRRTVRLSRPSRDCKHLWSLLRPKVESAHLGFGVERVVLAAPRIGRLRHEQVEQWLTGSGDCRLDRDFGELLDTLSGRLGSDRVTRVEPAETHIPERAFLHRPVRSCCITGPSARDRASRLAGKEGEAGDAPPHRRCSPTPPAGRAAGRSQDPVMQQLLGRPRGARSPRPGSPARTGRPCCWPGPSRSRQWRSPRTDRRPGCAGAAASTRSWPASARSGLGVNGGREEATKRRRDGATKEEPAITSRSRMSGGGGCGCIAPVVRPARRAVGSCMGSGDDESDEATERRRHEGEESKRPCLSYLNQR